MAAPNSNLLTETRLIVKQQGGVRVNRAWCHKLEAPINLADEQAHRKPSIAVVEIDLHSKYAELQTYSNGTWISEERISGPSFVLDKNEATLHLSEKHEGWTEIVLPDFFGWEVFCCDLARYTLRACLTSQLI